MRFSVIAILAVLALSACESPPATSPDIALTEACRESASRMPSARKEDFQDRIDIANERMAAEGYLPVADRIASGRLKVTKSPVVQFPVCAARYGAQGECDVLFDITVSGAPEDVVAFCNRAMFEEAAIYAIRNTAIFAYDEDGRTADYPSMIYPIRFVLD